MHVTCMHYCLHFMHGVCIFNACSVHVPCIESGAFHAWNVHVACIIETYPCMVQTYSMLGTDVFHAWYRHIPCVVLAFSMCVPWVVQVFPCIHHTVVTPTVQNMYKCCRSRKCIWGNIPMHAIFAVFIYFFIPLLSRSYNSSNFFSFKSHNPETSMSSMVTFLCIPSASAW